jgi:hypothetical protein
MSLANLSAFERLFDRVSAPGLMSLGAAVVLGLLALGA